MAISGSKQQANSKGSGRRSPLVRLFGRGKKQAATNDPAQTNRGEMPNHAPMIDYLPYKSITNDRYHFIVLKDKEDGYAEILSIRGQGINSMSYREQENIVNGFVNFLKTALEDMKVIISPFPADTSKQLEHSTKMYNLVNQELAQTQDPRKRRQLRTRLRYINDQIHMNGEVEDQLFNEEYLLVIFGRYQKDLINNRENAIRWGGNALILEPISLERKQAVLARINNLNTEK